jgi:type VII secretion protein EssC, C-terminal domain
MKSRYKITVTNRNIYKEIEIAPDMEQISLGTAVSADVRLRKELFFGLIQLEFKKINETWSVFCSDNIYFNLGDARKLMKVQLEHGSVFKVYYQDSDNEVFTVEFMIDFDYERKDYDRVIDISKARSIKISGAKDSDINIKDDYLGIDAIIIKKSSNKWILEDQGCRYGVFVNGERIHKQKEIADYDFFSVVGYSFFLKKDKLYTTLNDNIHVHGFSEWKENNQTSMLSYPEFNRNTRIQYEVPAEEIEIQQPVNKPALQKKSIILTLIPTIVMLAMTIILRGIIGGGGTFVIYSAVSMGMGVIMSIVTYIQDRKNYKKEMMKREESYRKYIEEKEKLIVSCRSNELRIRKLIYESLENSIAEAESFGKRIFEKTIDDRDYLQVYLGTGTIESVNQIKFTKQEFVDTEDPISLLPEELANKYRYIDNAPIISDFNTSCGVGIVGKKMQLSQILKNISLDLAIRHFYKEVKLVYILDEHYIDEFRWVRWLRNVENVQLDVKNIICDDESKNVLLENLYAVLSGRESFLAEKKETVFEEQYIVFVTNASLISAHPVSKYVKDSVMYGFTFVFLEEYEEKLPQGCTEIIRIDEDNTGLVLKSQNGDFVSKFEYPKIETETAEKIALKLGAVYVDEVSLEGQLTKNITMFELLRIISVDDLNLENRWKESQVYKTMAAPIGIKAGNEIVSLDISDKGNGHGPHGLIAGTTGSGKSEILQTYILSIATLFHPYDVGFVIIDFKGGGMANQFANLPHLIGTITNIDGREIDRSLLSIKAELVKRQEMFSKAGVNHINDYIKLFKAGKTEKPMPHLIMIVDEFAELKSEYPDFMKELISAARIGRTLGVHLILATQKPAGVVDAQIWSNSKFKLCLKVQTKEDSNEVLKSPLAAEIVEPGRAYFQVGNNEIFELIQSAYSGANVPEGSSDNEKFFTIYERNFWGKKTAVYTNKKNRASSSETTQLDSIVNYVSLYCKANSIQKLPGICLPSLEAVIRTEQLNYNIDDEIGYTVPLGIFDDPEMQKQGMVELEISKDNVYIVGSAQMGKTVLLQTLAYGLIRKYAPWQINIYFVDCGSMVLKIFEDSAHVGGVVLSSEEEKCKNLFKLLNTMIVERKKILSGKGVGNFVSYLEAGYTDMPLLVVIIDNMAAFKEYFPEQADQINSLTREAQGVGISFIVTAATSNAMNYRTQANFGKKIALNCNDAAEYSNVFGHCKITPRENAGRGLFVLDKRILEWQAAIFGESNREAERNDELKKYIEQRNSVSDKHAMRIPMVPEKLILAEEIKQNAKFFRNTGIVVSGMRFDTVEYDMVNINQSGSLALIGDTDSRIQFTKAFLTVLARNIVFHNAEAVIIDDKQKSLGELSSLGFVRAYTNNVAEGIAYISDFYDLLTERENLDTADTLLTAMLIINNAELLRQICSDKNMSKELSSALKRANDINAFILLAQIENAPVGFNSSEVLKTLKEERQGILFVPISENKFYEVNGRVKTDTVFNKTMGYHFDNGSYYKIKIFE